MKIVLNIKLAFLFTCLCLIPSDLFSQSQELAKIVNSLNTYSNENPQEKVYLHTDRTYYGQGESIWFQAYLTAGWRNEFSPLSSTIYVQLRSKNLELVEQQVIKAEGGFGHGVIDLSDSLPSGDYELIAFTNWMKNFDHDFFFRKQVSVIAGGKADSSAVNNTDNIDVQFFPEGGNLLENIPNKVAFKAVGTKGLGRYIKGEIRNDAGEVVSTLETTLDGMGYFFITPEPGRKYTCVINDYRQTFELPTAESSANTLRLTKWSKDRVNVAILTSNPRLTKGPFSLVVHTRGVPTFYTDLNLTDTVSFVNVSLKGMPEGIAHFTLFDWESRPVSERLLFVERENRKVELTADKKSYKKREKVSLILALDSLTNATPAVFSMSAVDLGKVIDKVPQSTIYTDLLLTSDLKGIITNPAYYFNKANDQREEHLDLVMLTHGWSRFTWEEALNGEKKEHTASVERGVSVTGRVVKDLSRKAEQQANVTLISMQDTAPLIEATETSEEGFFEFVNLDINSGEEVVLKAERSKQNNNYVTIEIDTSYFLPALYPRKNSAAYRQLSIEMDKYHRDKRRRDQIDAAYAYDSTATIVEGVVIEADKQTFDEEEAKKTIWGKGSDVFDFEKQSSNLSLDVWTNLKGRIPGVKIIQSQVFGDIEVYIRGTGRFEGDEIPATVMLDDVIVEDVSMLSGFTADQIQKVVVFKGLASSARFGSDGLGGVLAFYTKTSLGEPLNTNRIARENGMYTTKIYNSYKAPREFYAPKYEVEKPEHVKFDSRVLFHWQPGIVLSESNKAKIDFWTSDEETTIMINVQGLSIDGQPYSETIYVETGEN